MRKSSRTHVARDWPDEFEAHRCHCSDAPDTSGVNAAAVAQAEVSKEALAWYKDIYAQTQGKRDAASNLAMEQAGLQNELSREQLEASRSERERYNTTFKPIEAKIAADAMAYDTPQRREAAARSAVADTEIALASARDSSRRALERRGVTPGSGASLALHGSQDLGAAKLRAGAANTARRDVETIGDAKLKDAAGIGRGVFTNNTTQAQIGLSAGNSATGNAQVPVSVSQQGANLMQQGFNTSIQGNQSAGNLYATAANAGKTDNSALWGTVGSVAGAALMAFSDEDMKEDKKPVKGEIALSAARRMPVKSWRYKKGSHGDDGGRPHVGPMAQDVHAAAGEKVAPGGKVIDLVSMNGITLAAVQALDRKVSRLEKSARRK